MFSVLHRSSRSRALLRILSGLPRGAGGPRGRRGRGGAAASRQACAGGRGLRSLLWRMMHPHGRSPEAATLTFQDDGWDDDPDTNAEDSVSQGN